MKKLLDLLSHQLKAIAKKIDKHACPQKNVHAGSAEVFLKSLLEADYKGLHIYWLNKENQILLVNRPQAALMNRTLEETVGMNVLELAKGDENTLIGLKKIIAINQKIMASKQTVLLEETLLDRHYLSFKTPFYDQRGHVQGILGISTDITAQKEYQKLLYASKHATDIYLESILLSSRNNIWWVDTESRIIGCNDQQAKIHGLNSRNDLIGKSVFDLGAMLGWDPKIAQAVRDNDLKVMQTGEISVSEETVMIGDETRFFLSVKSPMFDDAHQVIGVLGISTDITAQKHLQKELEIAKEKAEIANRYKTEFIANISHDIRTPLIGISGMATLLTERLPAEFQSEMQAIVKASDELMQLLNSVINLTKVEVHDANKSGVESFNLQEMIESLIDLFSPIAQQKKLALQAHYQADIPLYFFSVIYILRQIILNLLGNAIKFTDHGKVTIIIERDHTISVQDNKIFPILITVEDTGIGIAEQYYDEIFEDFRRLHPSYQNKYPGSGLGLAIVKQSVAKLGGKVWVSSEVGKGSRFYLSLPLLVSEQVAVPNKTNISIEQILNIKPIISGRILLVEDNPLIQKVTAALLNKLNQTVEIAGTAAAAIELAQQNAYDLIFLDIGLPDKDGVLAAREIRQLAPHLLHTPIVALTAHLDPTYRETCLSAGINDLIIKPLNLENAQACLEKFGLIG